MNRYFCDI